jgi:ADP-dependent NAD(P)H-hydrate dehydratase / NAD(P)H-hydrate epimerase
MEILTGDQMRRVDRRAIDTLGIAGLLLMESAGRAVAEALVRDAPPAGRNGILVLCGKGNNGGDGLVAARWLARRGYRSRILLFARGDELSGDAAVNLSAARGSGLAVEEVPDRASWEAVRDVLARHPVVLDALLGTGIRGGARGLLAAVVTELNAAGAWVASVDLPSGLDTDRSTVEGPAVRASRTYTLCRPKPALVLEPAASFAGAWEVLPIGIPDEAVSEERPELEWLDRAAARALLPPRPRQGHKGTFGHLLAVAGSRGKSGAASLLARGALRSGVGLVTVACPASVQPLVARRQDEVMTEPLPETPSGALARTAAAKARKLLEGRDALALGPGLGLAPETRAVVLALASAGAPAVIDADGLNALALGGARVMGRLVRLGAPRVLTPHPGEAARLLGSTTKAVQADRLEAARSLARASGAVVTLKGHRTVVAAPDGRAALSASGNPGMGTAGTGDVLTGVVGAFLARGMSAWDSGRLAVWIHGDAGDRAAAELGEEALTAGDLLAQLPETFKALRRTPEVRTW